jgi:intracellular sulfur oxidation DsrE/DsrF family protein
MLSPFLGFNMKIHLIVIAAVTGLLSFSAFGQNQRPDFSNGPVIENYGPVVDVRADYSLKKDVLYRAVMDVSSSPDDDSALNRSIESAARYLNMHARAGVPLSNMKLAIVLHGSASKDALSSPAYESRYGKANPNDDLLNQLHNAGVEIYICGQSAGFAGFQNTELHESVKMATSAMTVLTRLQAEAWSLLP